MAKNVTLWGTSYSAVPSLVVPQTGGGSAQFYDVSETTATASDVVSGKTFLLAEGTSTTGGLSFITVYTGTSTPSASLGSNGDIYLKVVSS